ncbi:DNA cytosine methyltransferase [Chitinimonas koreensis]|uniref:DNA cytosine methyltransferase n=1 Tax=Chitinimonas koreensis TaxID=356302 RepID=UPI00040EFB64|nr:DNA cytosine methyltransferase [Chitinimonas koreensis]QNM94932.1 DNA cytosine methyltransferase [Chitinimonas koreensis]
MIQTEITHFHFCCGLGGGAAGMNDANPRVGNLQAKFVCLGGIDNDPAAIRDFERLTGVAGTVMDLFTRQQYTAFHGKEPPHGWTEATPADIRRAAQNRRPDIVCISSPCKAASGLTPESLSITPKYVALNELTLRCVWLMLEAWADDPVPLIVFENVPRLASRARHLLDQIIALFAAYGYVANETKHDCGQIGRLAQSRKRFLMVARHAATVPPFLYEPEQHRLQGVGTVLGRMPLPGDRTGGPMHRVPALQFKTWVRLAFVEAGKDWRSLERLAVENGHLRDYLIVPARHDGYLGVRRRDEHTGAVCGASGPSNGAFSVADPRPVGMAEYSQYGVLEWERHAGAISGQSKPGGGSYSVADPRVDGVRHNNVFRVVPFDEPAGTVTGGVGPTSGGQAVADPRRAGPTFGKYAVTDWASHAGTVIAGSTTGQGAYAVADPRSGLNRGRGDHYLTGGHYGVVGWDEHSGAVTAAACHDNGRWSVADPRMPASNDRLVAVIQSLDGTWHRPFTTLEMAALQSLIEPEEYLELDGLNDEAWRERIGNAIPRKAAKAIGEVMGTTLLLARSGETFVLGSTPIWVRDVALALTLPGNLEGLAP